MQTMRRGYENGVGLGPLDYRLEFLVDWNLERWIRHKGESSFPELFFYIQEKATTEAVDFLFLRSPGQASSQ